MEMAWVASLKKKRFYIDPPQIKLDLGHICL